MASVKVIKIGGKVTEDEARLTSFLQKFAEVPGEKVLVHGGGVIATQLAGKLGIETEMIEGRRITSKPMLDVATMVYAGLVNKNLVAKLQGLGVNAIGLTGADLNLIQSAKRNPEPIDFGWVGDIQEVKSASLMNLLTVGITPVLAPLTHDGKGNLLNTNADSIASFVAQSVSSYEAELILCFDMPGVMNGEEIIREINPHTYADLKSEGTVKDGMIPKLDLGFAALEKGVKKVVIKSFADIDEEDAGTLLVR